MNLLQQEMADAGDSKQNKNEPVALKKHINPHLMTQDVIVFDYTI